MRLSQALRASPERSFETLYQRHAATIYRYVLALLDSAADAEEVTQTTFLNAYRAIERGERPRNTDAWLHTIALNLCRQRFRQAARRPSEVPLEDDVAALVADDQDPTIQDVTRALKHLPFNQRAALVMREFEGRTPPEIAKTLDLSTSAVEALLFRARRSLREQLEGGLTCQQAERALSLQLDGALSRAERGPLRAHLRECADCARMARSMRGQRGALKSLAVLPLPGALSSAPQIGAGAAVTTAGGPVLGTVVGKLALGAAAAVLLGGVGYRAVTQHSGQPRGHRQAPAAAIPRATRAAGRPATTTTARAPAAPTPPRRAGQPRQATPAPAGPGRQPTSVPVTTAAASPASPRSRRPGKAPQSRSKPSVRPRPPRHPHPARHIRQPAKPHPTKPVGGGRPGTPAVAPARGVPGGPHGVKPAKPK